MKFGIKKCKDFFVIIPTDDEAEKRNDLDWDLCGVFDSADEAEKAIYNAFTPKDDDIVRTVEIGDKNE